MDIAKQQLGFYALKNFPVASPLLPPYSSRPEVIFHRYSRALAA